METLLERLTARPRLAAILLDVDGTLAPIVRRPEDSAVPDDARRELERLAERYALLALVTGRPTAAARKIAGLDAVPVIGTHGLELEPEAERWRERLAELRGSVAWPVEDKGLSLSYHYRGAADEGRARQQLEQVAEQARALGLRARFGRKVLEIVPPVDADKGTGIRRLLAQHQLRRALFAGDDTTDLDAFRALDDLELGVKVAVASPEGPPELRERADVVVEGTAGLVELLRTL